MKIARTIAEMRNLRANLPEPVGLVPTMGYLHEGHLSLIRRAKAENVSVVVSIFVNPAQFVPGEDLDKYPRSLERDLSMLEKKGVSAVFTPKPQDMYPPGFSTWIDVEKITERLEGAARPGHFRGVTTIVAKLFNIVRPARAYFGRKDAQQALVIKKMAADLDMGIEVITLPTVREPDGLAMSSRNSYLSKVERKAAIVLYKSLRLAEDLHSQGEKDARKIKDVMQRLIEKEPLARIDYISIADNVTLDELDKIKPPALVSLAVFIGKTRLIDNVVLKRPSPHAPAP
jgi:pantoate--beta-alanine ligase